MTNKQNTMIVDKNPGNEEVVKLDHEMGLFAVDVEIGGEDIEAIARLGSVVYQ